MYDSLTPTTLTLLHGIQTELTVKVNFMSIEENWWEVSFPPPSSPSYPPSYPLPKKKKKYIYIYIIQLVDHTVIYKASEGDMEWSGKGVDIFMGETM